MSGGAIKIKSGTYSESCTVQSNLTANQMKAPEIRPVLEFTNKRSLATVLVSGKQTEYSVGKIDTKIDVVDDKKSIGSNGYQFDVWTRLQRAAKLVSLIGTPTSDGQFSVSTVENLWYPGMNVRFHGQGYQARVMAGPSGGPGNYVWEFQHPDGTAFDWDVHVAPQQGEKTAFGGYTSYGEKSLRGYGLSYFPDTFIVHMTTQRKTIGISGGANTDVLWYEWADPEMPNSPMRGWRYTAERQNDVVFMQEDEYQKWEGRSNMRNADGTLRTKPAVFDRETGLPITEGDGALPQIEGGNETTGSGVSGYANVDDFSDMLAEMRKKSNMITGVSRVVITGEDGFRNAQQVMPLLSANQNVQYVVNIENSTQIGGPKVNAGFSWQSFNVDGDQITFVKHPMWDNTQIYTERSADGRLLQSGKYVFFTMEGEGVKNMEILAKGARGINRSLVTGYINGPTGDSASSLITEEDAIKYVQLKENLLVIYNSNICGIINKRKN